MKETILVDHEYFNSLISGIQAATKTIDLEVYIFADDRIGNAVADALIISANKGVKVRLLLDGIGTRHSKHLRKKMEKSGIIIKLYHPLFLSLFQWPLRLDLFKNITHYITHINSRNHRKTCAIDGNITYIGSANIIEYSTHLNERQRWHDITVKIEDYVFAELAFAFEKAWRCNLFKNRFNRFSKIQPESILRLNYTWRKRRNLYKSLLSKIENCHTRIYIINAYFIPRRFLLLKLIQAAKKGIKVCIILPGNSDVASISLLASSFYDELLKSGIDILHNFSGVLHAKNMIIDDWFCVGSSNLNFRSFLYDLEADVTIQTDTAKKKLEELFTYYYKHSIKMTVNDIPKRSLIKKMALKFLWKIRYWF